MGFPTSNGLEDTMFSIVPVIIIIGFVLVFGIIVVSVVQGIGKWRRNNVSPILTVDAKLSSKRTDVDHHHDADTDHK